MFAIHESEQQVKAFAQELNFETFNVVQNPKIKHESGVDHLLQSVHRLAWILSLRFVQILFNKTELVNVWSDKFQQHRNQESVVWSVCS